MPENELIDVIDDNENIVATVKKSTAQKEHLLRWGTCILVYNAKGRLLIHKRAAQKKVEPNKWDFSVGGWLISGEKQNAGALRELEEEIGAKNVDLIFLGKIRINYKTSNNISYVYKTVYNGIIKPQKEEISECEWIKLDTLATLMHEKDFTTWCEYYCNYHFEQNFGNLTRNSDKI